MQASQDKYYVAVRCLLHPECVCAWQFQDHSCCAAFPDRPEEWVAKNSRRIWRQDQIKREYWHQRAPVFLQSRNRAWVLKACFWDWQMSSRSDHLPHKEPGTLPCPCEQNSCLLSCSDHLLHKDPGTLPRPCEQEPCLSFSLF